MNDEMSTDPAQVLTLCKFAPMIDDDMKADRAV